MSWTLRRSLSAVLPTLLALAAAPAVHSQVLRGESRIPAVSGALLSSSRLVPTDEAAPAGEANASSASSRGAGVAPLFRSIGFDVHVGLNGAGGDVALPIAQHFNIRAGGDYFSYSHSFTEEGANVTAALHLGRGRVALDWYPFANGFRISPQVVFAIQTHVDATVLVPSGSTISLDGSDYVSSNADPLHGSAQVKTRRTAPGLTVGWGNIAPHGMHHWSFPVEAGFYYIGQPDLAVNFQGSACDPHLPQPAGCQDVTTDAGFQKDLSAFIRRNQNNLSYASFFPEASVGVGYRF